MKKRKLESLRYVGQTFQFAISETQDLHEGSLIAALGNLSIYSYEKRKLESLRYVKNAKRKVCGTLEEKCRHDN
jgi:hypothetical protein